MKEIKVSQKEIDDLYVILKRDAEKYFYSLNPDVEFTKSLIKGMIVNKKRYGYWACPCRLAGGEREKDLDIICPCDYRDSDLNDFGACYCALYINDKFNKDSQIPERRGLAKNEEGGKMKNSKMPVWRCKVCGYLCARENPPDKCPICGVEHDRFEKFEV
jgi:ferredoxin-thioredoxin reductase catalytic chain